MTINENEIILYDSRNKCWLYFSSPINILQTNCTKDVVEIIAEAERQSIMNRLWVAGFISYEAGKVFDTAMVTKETNGFPLAWFGIYNQPKIIYDIYNYENLDYTLTWESDLRYDEYEHAFSKIKSYIESGDTYQINFTYRLFAESNLDPFKIFVQLARQQKNHYGAFINTNKFSICSASPELFFLLDKDHIESDPMKGTIERGLTYSDDINKSEELFNSSKDRAENLMIVDMVRNDLGRIAETGSVEVAKLFNIEKYPTLWQMTSKVKAKTNASIVEIFKAMFPAASITGAPKISAIKIINKLETSPRKIYTGTIGFLSPHRLAQFNVAIRTILFDKGTNKVEYGVGGGIVWDSICEKEMAESRTKSKILKSSFPNFQLLETILWEPNKGFFLLDLHLKRLKESAIYFDYFFDLNSILKKLNKFSETLDNNFHKIRLLLSSNCELILESFILENAYKNNTQSIGLAKSGINSNDVFLYHKTTNRKIYEEALKDNPGFYDVILYNEKNEITESTIANVAVDIGGELYTPPVSCGLLAGTLRASLLAQGKIKEKIIHKTQLHECGKIYLLNSVKGMYEIKIRIN